MECEVGGNIFGDVSSMGRKKPRQSRKMGERKGAGKN